MNTVNFGLQNTKMFSQVKNNKKQSSFSGFKKGMIVNGVITQVSDSISINLDGVEVQVASSAIKNATEGETRKFEIIDVSKDGIAIKEVGQSQTSGNLAARKSTVVMAQAARMINTAVENKEEKEKENNKEKTHSSVSDVTGRMTGSDYGAIAEEGVSPEDMEINAFDAALERAKEKHSIENSLTSVNHASNFVPKEFQSDARQSKVAAKLMMANLPPTAANVAQVTQELDNLEICNQISDRTISYLIEMDLEPTSENLYRGSYAGTLTFSDVSESVWQALEEQAKSVIEQAGLPENAQSIKNAKWLLANELPLTKESIRKVADLQAARETLDEDECTDRMIAVMAKGFSAKTAVLLGGETPDPYVNKDLSNMVGSTIDFTRNATEIHQAPFQTPPLDINGAANDISQMLLGQAGQSGLIAAANARIVNGLPTIQDEAITKTLVQDQEVTLGNLLNAQEEINQGDTSWRSIPITSNTALAEIRAKRQLEEIRLKMTTEAGNRLAAKGIRLDTTGLQKVVEELRRLEQDYFKSFQNGTATPESLAERMELFQKTTEAVFNLQRAPSFLLGMSFGGQNNATLTSLSDDASSVNMRQVRASGAYESLSTEIRKDLGDSIKKAFQNVDSILEDMHLETTEANQRAVRILGYNNLEITEENINEMKQYDGEVNYTLSKLHPAVAISMIKEGLNPLDTPISELNDQIDRIREQEGITSEKKFTSYLWKLEKSENFTREEKSAFIGIYRLINAIKNSDGAAVGSVVNAGQELTLHNLLQAVRTIQNGGVDAKVDSETGMSEADTKRDSIVNQILGGYGKAAQAGEIEAEADTSLEEAAITQETEDTTTSYTDIVAENILDTMTPEKLNSIWQELSGNDTNSKMRELLSMSLEQFAEQVRDAEQTQAGTQADMEYNHAAAEHIRSILEGSGEAVDYLLENELTVSANMIDAVRQLSNGGRKFFEKLHGQAEETSVENREAYQEAAEHLEESFTDEASAKQAYESFLDAAKQVVNDAYYAPGLRPEDTWGLQSMNNMVNLISALSQRREQYQVPVQTRDGSVTAVNLTLIRNAGDKGKVHVDIESEHLGQIHADYKINQGRISGFIVCSDRIGQDTLHQQEGQIRQKLEEAGLVMGSMNYAIRNLSSYQAMLETSEPDSMVDTRILYHVAKCVIETVKEAENAAGLPDRISI